MSTAIDIPTVKRPDMLTELLDSSGDSLQDSKTSAAGILRDVGRKINLDHQQSYISPQYVEPDEIVRMGERLPAEYIVHTDTWTKTNMGYLSGVSERCQLSADRHDVEQKQFKAKHTTLTIPSMFLAAAASLIAGLGASQDGHTLTYVAAVLAAASGFTQTVLNYHEWNIRSNKHGNVAVRFGGLAEHIRALEHLHEERRRSYEVESMYVQMTLGGIMHEEPPLPDPGSKPWYRRMCIFW